MWRRKSKQKPDLLYLSPIVPRPFGNGLAMRCSVLIEALSSLFNIHLHVVPLVDPAPDLRAWRELRSVVADAVVHRPPREEAAFARLRLIDDDLHRAAGIAAYRKPLLCRFDTEDTIRRLERRHRGSFDAVHVTRLYLASFIPERLREPGTVGLRTLDLDDYESVTHGRFAERRAASGMHALADVERHETRRYRVMEDEWLLRFDRVALANPHDCLRLEERFSTSSRFIHVPNAVAIPSTDPLDRPTGDGPLRVLFVGNLGFFPNEDAVQFFCESVLPLVRRRSPRRPVRFVVAGAGPSRHIMDVTRAHGATVEPNVRDLARAYRRADVVVAPIRVGGGSRIKVLEAFAHKRPVVSTTAAADGIAAENGRHLMIADDPRDFADACLALAENRTQGEALTEAAFDLVRKLYARDVVVRSLRATWRNLFQGHGSGDFEP